MPRKIEVRLREFGQIYSFICEEDIVFGDIVVVEQDRGIDWGEIVSEIEEVPEDTIRDSRRVIRRITEADQSQISENKRSVSSAVKICVQKVEEHKLDMKLIDAEYTFDRTKIIFYFTAEGRVDFRELVKDLAKIFKIRIEMRQIGVRDEAKIFGGFGMCGRNLCCKTFLKNFVPVTIKFAKDQQLPINPQKISGICQRLMCCLSYEYEVYAEILKHMPSLGEVVNTKDGKGKVVSVCPLKKTISIEIEEGKIVQHSLEE